MVHNLSLDWTTRSILWWRSLVLLRRWARPCLIRQPLPKRLVDSCVLYVPSSIPILRGTSGRCTLKSTVLYNRMIRYSQAMPDATDALIACNILSKCGAPTCTIISLNVIRNDQIRSFFYIECRFPPSTTERFRTDHPPVGTRAFWERE
jgi:hypothetical protein